MLRKTQRPNYALASSSISDIPPPKAHKDSQFSNKNEGVDYKQNSSIYQGFSQSRSRVDQVSSLHFSTARPFYEDLAEDYYDRPQNQQRTIYNLQQTNDYNKERAKNKKGPNKKIMIFSYSNIVLFNNKLQKIITHIKKRTFYTLRHSKPSPQNKPYQKQFSLNSGETNNTAHEEHFFRMGLITKKPVGRYQLVQATNILEGWVEYRNLIDKRGAYNQIYEWGGQRKRFSLSLSQSLKIQNAHQSNYFLTDYNQSNQISLSNGLPQPTEQSLVYTLEHNTQSTRKEFTQSTLEKLPTLKHYPSTVKEKGKPTMETEANIQSSPVYRLKSLKSSGQTENEHILKSNPLQLIWSTFKNITIKTQRLMERPFQKGFSVQNKETNASQKITLNDGIRINLSSTDQREEDQLQLYSFQLPQGVQQSGKYSDVSNYKIENTTLKQEQTYHLKVNYVQSHTQEQTVRKINTVSSSAHQHTPPKIQRYYLSPNDPQTISTPHFASSSIQQREHPQREKLVSQLENDRIRIFGKTQNIIKSSNNPINQLKPQISMSPIHTANHISPLVMNDRRYFSPNIQSDRNIRPLINTVKEVQPTSLKVIEPIKYQKNNQSPNYFVPQKHPICASPQRDVQIVSKSPLVINRLQRNTPVQHVSNPQTHPQHILKLPGNTTKRLSPQAQNIRRPNFIIPQRLITLPQNPHPPRQAQIAKMPLQDYGFNHNMPFQRPQHPLRQTLSPPNQSHKPYNQYQLTAQRKYISPPKRDTFPHPPFPIPAQSAPIKQIPRPMSSASSPKLFFNYHPREQHLLQQLVVHSNMTKNSSSISRPKSMNSKLYVTLRKQQ